MSEKKHLGVEFYRNFVGIERPLKVNVAKLKKNDKVCSFLTIYDLVDFITIHRQSDGLKGSVSMRDCKPYLRTIEDLSDEELLSIIKSALPQNIITVNERGSSYIDFYMLTERSVEYIFPIFIDFTKGFGIDCDGVCCDGWTFDFQVMLDKMRELHCDPKAKEYIDNGLALRVEK